MAKFWINWDSKSDFASAMSSDNLASTSASVSWDKI